MYPEILREETSVNKVKIEVIDTQKEDRTENLQKKLSGKAMLEELMKVKAAADAELEDRDKGEVNPYTGREYDTNTVRVHADKIGYVQVYDRSIHGWETMTEWAFLGKEEQKKVTLGDDYEPPVFV